MEEKVKKRNNISRSFEKYITVSKTGIKKNLLLVVDTLTWLIYSRVDLWFQLLLLLVDSIF